MGNKPWQITREAITEAEAAKDIGNPDTVGGGESGVGDDDASGPSEWEFDESTEAAFGDGREDGEDAPPPTPILDAYERSRDPVEMDRLIQMSFDSLPERAGPQRYNHKRREHQRYRTIRNIKYKEKAQRIAAHERKLQKRRDRKARDLALFATWRGTAEDSTVAADAKQ